MKKWSYFKDRDELRYAGKPGEVVAIIDTGDIEIYVNKNGEINEIAIYNVSKYVSPEDLEEIANIIEIDKILNSRPYKQSTAKHPVA